MFEKEIKLAVVGSRDFSDYESLKKHLDNAEFDVLISGGARGADSLANQYAKEHGKPIVIFYPDWNGLGNKAGFIRNRYIIENSDKVIAFWDQKSKGASNSINIARELKKKLKIVKF